MVHPGRCYHCDTNRAVYDAVVTHDFCPHYLLCIECAAELRATDDIIKIETLRPVDTGK